MERSYTYDPANVAEKGKDRMRFELGDTMVEGASDTTALTDEEIEAALATWPNAWKRAKLMLLESLYHRFAYEVDTSTGPLSLSLQARAQLWKEMYEELEDEVDTECINVPKAPGGRRKPPYFYAGMMENHGSLYRGEKRHGKR